MRKLILFIFLGFLSVVGYSQIVIENPEFGFSASPYVHITKIEIRDTATILSFRTSFPSGNTINIPKETYIQPFNTDQKLYIKSAIGIPIGGKYVMPASGIAEYQLIFPEIDPSVTKLDYGEANQKFDYARNLTWFIYDIRLKTLPEKSMLPDLLKGNWYNRETGDWEVSFFDSLAIYKSKVWVIDEFKFRKGKGSISLKDNIKRIKLIVKQDKSGWCTIGESSKSMKEYVSNLSEINPKAGNDEYYKAPVFQIDSAIFSGYLKGYSPRMGVKTFEIQVANILTEQSEIFPVQISDMGTFKVKIPLYYPHRVLIKSPLFVYSVFLEPGKELFTLFDSGNSRESKLFMGDCARVNKDMLRLEGINSYKSDEMQKRILTVRAADYKAWLLDLQKKDLEALDSFRNIHLLNARAYQIKKMEIDYRYGILIMDYSSNFVNVYRLKNRIPASQMVLPVNPEQLTSDYYSFNNSYLNNPLAVISDEYRLFIARIKNVLTQKLKISPYSVSDIAIALETEGYSVSEEEKKLIFEMKKNENLPLDDKEKEFAGKYAKQTVDFFKKYSVFFKDFTRDNSKESININSLEKYLIGERVTFTEDEKNLIAAIKENENSANGIKRREFQRHISVPLKKFYADHQSFINLMISSQMNSASDENLKKKFGLEKGFLRDIIFAQNVCFLIMTKRTTPSDQEIQSLQQKITTPFIAEYISLFNKMTKSKIELKK